MKVPHNKEVANHVVPESCVSDAGWLMVTLAVLLFAGWLGTLFVGGDPAPLENGAAQVGDEGTQTNRV